MQIFVCSFVRLFYENLSRALNLYLSLIGLSQASLRSVSGQSQVSPRSVSGLSVPTSSVRTEPKILRLVIIVNLVLLFSAWLRENYTGV